MSEDHRPELEIRVPVTVETAWRALRDKESVLQWHGWQAADLDAEVDQIFFANAVEDAENHVLVADGGDRITVTADGDGARITLTRAPLSGNTEWDAYYRDITEGWIAFLQQLRFVLVHGITTPRRTHFFGTERSRADEAAARLGLSEVADVPPGSPYEAEIAGERVHGRVWFRSDSQLGLSVDEWGNGLLVFGGGMAIVTTYGLDDAEFEALGERWRERWPSASDSPVH
ncbi:SRPBCC domain-containing protein [Amycolatopsis sp. YIM 10]|uniref:SRPBCC family protein n=1 Tax=Amycolatopsis sp. YIM 10 TaxID=2653857 RepID=UPI00128FD1C8|nr:hypothetical protein [Amycolatopsis sp. YIM 10]QFU92183.1 hypothetical protein YIM_35115 [Amycolatopsis sp. YIM 10]